MERRLIGDRTLWRLSRKFKQGRWDRPLVDDSLSRLEQATTSRERYRLLSICLATVSLQHLPEGILDLWSAELLQVDSSSRWNSPNSHLAALICTCLILDHTRSDKHNFDNSSLPTEAIEIAKRLRQEHSTTLRK